MFWNAHKRCVQAELFIGLGRIFDESSDAYPISRLVNGTRQHTEYFSRDALKSREMRNRLSGPDRLVDLLTKSWEPRHDELKYLSAGLQPWKALFKEKYLPIRNKIYAHKLVRDEWLLFQGTNKSEVGKMIDFLNDIVDGIARLFDEGRKPELGKASFDASNAEIRASVESVLQKIQRPNPSH